MSTIKPTKVSLPVNVVAGTSTPGVWAVVYDAEKKTCQAPRNLIAPAKLQTVQSVFAATTRDECEQFIGAQQLVIS